jgi:hypothetical protein
VEGCTVGSGEVPGERKPVMRDDSDDGDDNKCLNETYSNICICKILLHAFPIQNGLKQGDAHYFSTLF